MNFLRKHWYDLGGFLAIIVLSYVFTCHARLTQYQNLMWLSLVTLFFHQLEEYRIAGTFPGMMDTAMYKSAQPDRYPLNTNTALIVNVCIGWTLYVLAAAFAEKAIWLGMASILVSAGNIIAHTFLFNIKGKTIYNAGLISCWLCFAPCTAAFFCIIHKQQLVTLNDYLIGIPLGIIINVIGILKMIDWLANPKTTYTFSKRHLLKKTGHHK